MATVQRKSGRECGYNAEWDRESLHYRRQHPLCLGCEAMGRVTPTKVTDHIQPHRGSKTLFWDPLNRQPACRWHHDVVKQRLERMWDAGEIGVDELRLDSAAALEVARRAEAAATHGV